MRTALFLKPAINQYSFYFPSPYPLHKSQISPQNLTHFLRLYYLATLQYYWFPMRPNFFSPFQLQLRLTCKLKLRNKGWERNESISTHVTHIHTHTYTLIHYRKFLVDGLDRLDVRTLHPLIIIKRRHLSSSPIIVQFASYLLSTVIGCIYIYLHSTIAHARRTIFFSNDDRSLHSELRWIDDGWEWIREWNKGISRSIMRSSRFHVVACVTTTPKFMVKRYKEDRGDWFSTFVSLDRVADRELNNGLVNASWKITGPFARPTVKLCPLSLARLLLLLTFFLLFFVLYTMWRWCQSWNKV